MEGKKINWWIVGGTALVAGVGAVLSFKHFTKPASSGFSRYSAPSKCQLLLQQIESRKKVQANLEVRRKIATAQRQNPINIAGLTRAIAVQRTIIINLYKQYSNACGINVSAPPNSGCDCNNNGVGGTLQVTGTDSGGNAVYGCVTGGCGKPGVPYNKGTI